MAAGKVRVNCFAISLDGYGAGASQSLENPMGLGGGTLHQWFRPTRVFQNMVGGEGGTTGVDNDFAERGLENLGAWILGRNMFAASRGPWPENDEWKGWWGETPPYHTPVFVLTSHARKPLEMAGGTTFFFVTGGIDEALERAKSAAGERDVRIGGGVSTVRQYLRARSIDEMHLAISPTLLGSGEHLLSGLDLNELGYRVSEHTPIAGATHVVLTR